MEHHHEYGPECEHHEEMRRMIDELTMRLDYYVAVLDDRLHTLGSHVEAIEEEEAESNEEPSSHEDENEDTETEGEGGGDGAGDDSAQEVVIEDDTGLPDLPTQEHPADNHLLPMMGH